MGLALFTWPYISYCNIVWAQASHTVHLDKIFKIQKKYCRLISFSKFRAHSEPLFKQLSIFNVYKLYNYHLALFMYKQVNNLLPTAATFPFILNSTIHHHYTRQHDHIYIGRTRTHKRQMTVVYQGPKLWNSLPDELKGCFSINCFRRKITNYIKLSL